MSESHPEPHGKPHTASNSSSSDSIQDAPHDRKPQSENPPPPDHQSQPNAIRPIISEHQVGRLDFLRGTPPPEARLTRVYIAQNGELMAFEPHQPPRAIELVRRGVRMMYEIDMGMHSASIEIDLPSRGDAFEFHASIDLHWRVTNPCQVVYDGISDLKAAISPLVVARLRSITRGFDIEDVEQAELVANEELAREPIGVQFGLQIVAFVRLAMDQASRDYADTERRLARQEKVEELTQAVRTKQEEHKRARLEQRVSYYRTIIDSGDTTQFALQLAQNPDEVEAVAKALMGERDTRRRELFNFITKLIESDALDRWEVDDHVQTTLLWLKDGIHKVITEINQGSTSGSESALQSSGAPSSLS